MAHALPVQFTEFTGGPTGFLVDMGIRSNGDLWVGKSDGMPQVKLAAGSTFSESSIGYAKPGTGSGATCGSGGVGGYPGVDFYWPQHVNWFTNFPIPMHVLLSGAGAFSDISGLYDFWTGVTNKPNGDVWACSYQNYNPDPVNWPDYQKGKVYRKLSSESQFTKIIGPDSNFYSAIAADADNGIYLAVYNGDVYYIPSGSTTPSALGFGSKRWTAITVDFSTGDVYFMEGDDTHYGHIYVRLGGTGSLTDLGNWSSKKWTGLCMCLDGRLFGTARDESYPYTGRVYKRELPPTPPANHIFYVRSDGANVYPYETPANAAPTIYDLTNGMTTHGMILDTLDTVNLKGIITEAEGTYHSCDLNGAELIGDSASSNLDVVNIFSNAVVKARKIRNISFLSSDFYASPIAQGQGLDTDIEGCKIIIDARDWGEGYNGYAEIFSHSGASTKFRLVNNLFVAIGVPPTNAAEMIITVDNSSMAEFQVENNTFEGIVYDPNDSGSGGIKIELRGTGTIPVFAFRNNIVSGAKNKLILDFTTWTPIGGMDFQHKYNDYYGMLPDSPELTPLTLDSTEKNVDPLYVGGTGTDPYALQATSPCKKAGYHYDDSPILDILGITRDSPPSMGAYDFPAPPPVATPENPLFIEQFRVGRPNINNFMQQFLVQAASVMTEIAKIALVNNIDTSYGAELDKWGAIVDLPRDTLNDVLYRNEIKFKIFLNTSKGTPEIMIAATKYLTGATSVQYEEQYPARVIITIDSLIGTFSSVYDKLKRIKPAGVALILQVNESATPFAFGGEGGMPPFFPEALGFEETGGGASVGGNITELIS